MVSAAQRCAAVYDVFLLLCSNDAEWYRLRSAVQQLMMRQKEVEPFLPSVDPVALDFVQHIRTLADPSGQVPDFSTELGRWSLECEFSSFLLSLTE